MAESLEVPRDASEAAPIHRLRHSQVIHWLIGDESTEWHSSFLLPTEASLLIQSIALLHVDC